MSADFSEMNICARSLESESGQFMPPPGLYTTQQPHSKNLDLGFLDSLQEIPLEELLAESSDSGCLELEEDDLPRRSQGGLTAVENELLSALMEIRDHLPSAEVSTDPEDFEHASNPPEMIEEQSIIQSIEKDDHEYHVVEISSGYESELDTTAEPETSNIDDDSNEDPSTTIPCLSLPRYRSMTPEPESEPLPSHSIANRRNSSSFRLVNNRSTIRPRPVRQRRPIMDPLKHNRKKLDSNLRMAIFLREDPQKYSRVLDNYQGIAPMMCHHRREIRSRVNKRGMEYETGFMRWRVHQRSKLAIAVQWCMNEKMTKEVIRRIIYEGKAMELDGRGWTGQGDRGVRYCGRTECGVGFCGWRGMEIFLAAVEYTDDEEELEHCVFELPRDIGSESLEEDRLSCPP